LLSPWNWLKPLQRQSTVCRRRQRRYDRAPQLIRPRLEALEDRITPTLFVPTVFTDGVGADTGTLRQAVIDANNDAGTDTDTIQLAAGTYTLTIPNVANNHDVSSTQGDLNITNTAHALVIQGATDSSGKPTSIIDQTTADRVIQILNLGGGAAATVTFKNLIIEGGNAQDDGSAGAVAGNSVAQGGGILDDGGNVTLSNVVVQNNKATAGTLQFAQGGGIYARDGALAINNSVVESNTATGGAGAMGTPGGDANGGGVFYGLNTPGPQLSITNSTVEANLAQGGSGQAAGTDGGEADGGGVYTIGTDTTTITGSTLAGNAAIGGQGGPGQVGAALGGGAFVRGNNIVVNTTIAANEVSGGASAGGGVYFEKSATGQFTNVTVALNIANTPAGVVNVPEGAGLDNNNGSIKDVTLVNTLVAGNTINARTDLTGADVRGQFISGGHNLIGVADGVNDPGFHSSGDRTGTAASPLNAVLGPLQNNGGPTRTLLPLAGSPALGAGNSALAPSTDQRGQARPPGGPSDIGAVQVSAIPSPPAPPAPPPAPTPPPILHTPALLALFDHLFFVISTETVNANGSVTVTDTFFGFPFLVSAYNSSGNLTSVLLFWDECHRAVRLSSCWPAARRPVWGGGPGWWGISLPRRSAGVLEGRQARIRAASTVPERVGRPDAVIEGAQQFEDHPGQQRAAQGRPEPAGADGHAHGRRRPDAGGRRQAAHLVLLAQLEDDAAAQKADAGDESLNNTAEVGRVHAGLQRHQREQRGPQRHQHVRARSGRLARTLALETNHAAQHGGDGQPRQHAPEVRPLGPAEKQFFVQRRFHVPSGRGGEPAAGRNCEKIA
jgi:hypothetical protein